MMWFWGSGFGWSMWVFGAVMMVVLWAGIAWLIVMLVGSHGADETTPQPGPPPAP